MSTAGAWRAKVVNVLGVAVVDAISGPLERYPEPRSLPQVITERVEFCPGGGAVNAAATLAQLGVPTRLFTKVGDDQNGRLLIDTLAGYGVDTSTVTVSSGESTPFTFVGLHRGGERTFIHTPGSNLTYDATDLDREALFDCSFLLYPDLHVLPRLDGAPAASLLREAKSRGVVTVVDECWGLGPRRELFETVAAEAHVLLPSVDDLAAIYRDSGGDVDPRALAAVLLQLGPRIVVMKLGSDGALVAAGDAYERVPAQATDVVDATGAGDAFNVGFIVGLLRAGVADAAAVDGLGAGMPASVSGAATLGARVAAARLSVTGASSPIGAVDIPGSPADFVEPADQARWKRRH